MRHRTGTRARREPGVAAAGWRKRSRWATSGTTAARAQMAQAAALVPGRRPPTRTRRSESRDLRALVPFLELVLVHRRQRDLPFDARQRVVDGLGLAAQLDRDFAVGLAQLV